MSDLQDILNAVQQSGAAFDVFTAGNNKRLDALGGRIDEVVDRIEELESRRSGPGMTTSRAAETATKGFERFVRTGDTSGLEHKDMSIGGGAAAGQALVPEFIANQIIARAIARSRLVSLVRQTPTTTSDYVRLLNLRGATAAWSSETGSRSGTSTPLLREVKPTHGELYALPTFTRWLAEDSKFNVSQFVTDNVSDVFAKSLEHAVLKGTGSNQPTGILNTAPVSTADGASPERSADAIKFVSRTSDHADDLITAYFDLKPEYRARGSWAMTSATLATVRKLRDSSGSGYLWQQNLSASIDAPDGLLLGRPVVTSEDLDASGSSPAGNSVLFGDFDTGYELVRIGGMIIIRDDISVKGKISLYIAQRFGGRLVDNDAIRSLHL